MPNSKHIIVVGSGIAGLIAALELSRQHAVTLVTKAQLADSNTRWAQGGIAAAMFSDDSAAAHVADTLAAGAGLCNPQAVNILCTEGPDRIRDLIRLGVRFDQTPAGDLARGLEAAHSKPRILHAGGDATGLSIEMALVHAVRAARVKVLEHTFALDLVLRNGIVSGLEVLNPAGHPRTLDADAVILASGGAGQLYLHTTNPSVATGDGIALALRAGAQLADTEFYQFHPTALATTTALDSSPFLISEAVRGEGAVLLDIHGHRFMPDLHPAAELAPRDVVARGIARQMALQQGHPVLLDATALSSGFLARRFPSIDAATRARNLDWSRDPIPVTPAAHYWMGGVRTDTFGRTSIPGLFAVGEVACTGVHGANRLASNSLLESLTFAWRCAHLFLADSPSTGVAADFSPLLQAKQIPGLSPDAPTTPITRLELQTLLWTHVGIERNAAGLRSALDILTHSHAEGSTIFNRETTNLLQLARILTRAALAREESRGAHSRTDFPQPCSTFQHSLVYTSKQKAGARTADANQVAVPC